MKDYIQKKSSDPVFKKKQQDRWKKWVDDNRDYYNNWQRDYKRGHWLKVDGKGIKVEKRPRPEVCELGGAKHRGRKLDYHHWDDSHPENGIWACSPCHRLAEFVDSMDDDVEFKEKAAKYLELKKAIEKHKAP